MAVNKIELGKYIVFILMCVAVITYTSIGIQAYNQPIMKDYAAKNDRKKLLLELGVAGGVIALCGVFISAYFDRKKIFS